MHNTPKECVSLPSPDYQQNSGKINEIDGILNETLAIDDAVSMRVGGIYCKLDETAVTSQLDLSRTGNPVLSPSLTINWDGDQFGIRFSAVAMRLSFT